MNAIVIAHEAQLEKLQILNGAKPPGGGAKPTGADIKAFAHGQNLRRQTGAIRPVRNR